MDIGIESEEDRREHSALRKAYTFSHQLRKMIDVRTSILGFVNSLKGLSLGKSSFFSSGFNSGGSGLPLDLATSLSKALASSYRPLDASHRGDSFTILGKQN